MVVGLLVVDVHFVRGVGHGLVLAADNYLDHRQNGHHEE
jgi:hypothetical protein